MLCVRANLRKVPLSVPQEPQFSIEPFGDSLRFGLSGDWTIGKSRAIEATTERLFASAASTRCVILDFEGVDRLDTAGAWLLDRTRQSLAAEGIHAQMEQLTPEYGILLKEAGYRDFGSVPERRHGNLVDLLADIGEGLVGAGHDFYNGMSFLGEVVASVGKLFLAPRQFRLTAFVNHIEAFGLRSVPIIALINLLVGGIVAQQGVYQLSYFGATTYAIDLIGILILREMGVFLTSIMIAGRSGAAITAELGSMKMREEVDALRVMGLRPIDVLIVPRLAALIICLPMLTFVADMSALFGGLLVTWGYAGISPETFMVRLQSAVSMHSFLIGMIKAPFMGLIVGLIASIEGLATEGSAESLGRQVTSSVVKSIFMVIVVDGLFTMFFASIKFY
jgi:phospholipid/cholesterol/gamma-HCH transport system permease protein